MSDGDSQNIGEAHLLQVATHPQQRIGQLTPKGWAETFRRQAAA